MSTISITKLYELLSAKVGKDSAENLTTYIEVKVKEELDNKTQVLATKADIARLDVKIADTKTEIIKWMFIFWVGQVAATFGFILLFLKK
ncbi:MAG: hypothetical protein ACRDE2_13060 [Chitinophagaceae bacterium]